MLLRKYDRRKKSSFKMNKYQALMAERVEKAKKKALKMKEKNQGSDMRSPRVPKAVRLDLYLAHKEAGTLRLYAQKKCVARK